MNPVDDRIRLAHGAGGRSMRALIQALFVEPDNAELARLGDGAVVALPDGLDGELVITTDAHVVKPVEFPGGDLGRLSVCGVVNDLAMMGATTILALTSAIVLEEGFPVATLERLHASARAACAEAGARILAGDTKVMGRGELDGVVFTTTGLGLARHVVRDDGLRPNDLIITTGTLGDHGLAVLAARHGLGLEGDLRSDVAPLNGLIARALAAVPPGAIHAMKDPTRGGLVGALGEMAEKARVSIQLREAAIPLSPAVRAASELLGIDPLAVANEGKALIGIDPAFADAVLEALRGHPLGRDAAIIGVVSGDDPGTLLLDTGFGVRRLIERDGDPLPRIC
jgi:hydrogenase expression/formation protein HypE